MVWVMLNQEGGELILAATIGAMQWAAGAGLLLAVINAGLWHRYRTTAQARGIPPLSRAVLNGMSIPLHLVGHALPVVAFALALFALSMATPIAYIIGGPGGGCRRVPLEVHHHCPRQLSAGVRHADGACAGFRQPRRAAAPGRVRQPARANAGRRIGDVS